MRRKTSYVGTTLVAVAALALSSTSALAVDDGTSPWDPEPGTRAAESPVSAAVESGRAGAAAGAVILGQTASSSAIRCGTLTGVQGASGPGASSYTAPVSGVLSSFSHNATAASGAVRVLVFRGTSTPGTYTLVGKSAVQALTPSTLNTFATRIAVLAGDLIGLQVSDGVGCAFTGTAGDRTEFGFGFDADTSSTFTPTDNVPGDRFNISAVLEPDADGDQYGDVSQDACPQSALTQAACPAPDTKLKRRPFFAANGKVVFKFKSTIPGSTFLCKVDRRPFRPCSSPLRKRFGLGTHKIKFQAISPFGVPDPTPLKVRVRLVP